MKESRSSSANSGKIVAFLKAHRTWIMCIWVVLMAGLTMLPSFYFLKFIYDIEQLSFSFRLQARGTEEISPDETKIIILAADDRSL